ncbi:hypothetical protein GR304_07175 [Microvirga sp. SYSU G3D207]|uniref:Transposase n=1 Tax=Microvirga arsenatis TaxID=2692265 RepID=A0ABW9YZY3_9HYPH|nr:hypothetical protein [Microvirga arsenatis]NBJ24411.1 hypothetical protein [Microvirga arsenatis]
MSYQLCQFHFLRETAHPIFEADRHAKKELKNQVRGIRRIERAVEERDDPEATIVLAYCAAVRSAITDDSRAPLAASGLKLRQRLEKVADSLARVQQKWGFAPALTRLCQMIARALERTVSLWPDVEYAYRFVHTVVRRVNGVQDPMQRYREKAGTLAEAFDHFLKVTRSYRRGLFHTYVVPDLPRAGRLGSPAVRCQPWHYRDPARVSHAARRWNGGPPKRAGARRHSPETIASV